MIVLFVVFIAAMELQAGSFFHSSDAVWPVGESETMNMTVDYSAKFQVRDGERPSLRMVGYGAYRISVNGNFVGFGPARGPKGLFRPDVWSFDGFIRAGENTVLIEVNGSNVNSFYLMDQRPFLQAEVLVDGKVVARTGVDGDFTAVESARVRRAPRYSFQRTFAEIWRFPRTRRHALRLARCPEPSLIERLAPLPQFDVTGGLRPVAFSTLRWNANKKTKTNRCLTFQSRGFKGYPTNELYRNTFDDLQRFETVAHRQASPGERMAEQLSIGTMQSATFDLGEDKSGFPGMTVRCKKPTVIYLTWDEVLLDGRVCGKERQHDSTCGIVWELCEPGEYRLDAFDTYTMRYFDVIVREGHADVSDVRFRSCKSPYGETAGLRSSDADLDAVFAAATETFRQNAVDVFMDCPSRERGGWLCDSYFTAPVATLLSGNADLEKLFVSNYSLAPAFEDIPDGMLPMCYPADHPDRVFIPNWAMWFVIQVNEYFRRSGDAETVAALRPRLERLVEYLWKYRNADGLLESLPGWVFVEWSEANKLVRDVSYPSNMIWAEALEAMAALYGRHDLAAEAGRIRSTVRKQSWTGRWFCDNAVRDAGGVLRPGDRCSETCQYYALFSGIADEVRDPDFARRVVEEFGPLHKDNVLAAGLIPANAFIGDYLRLKTLERMGCGERLLAECKCLFANMARQTGTLWEHETTKASCCHGFASYAAQAIVGGVLGVDVDLVAKTVRLRETNAGLAEARLSLPVGEMMLSVVRRHKGGRSQFELCLPSGWKAQGNVDYEVTAVCLPRIGEVRVDCQNRNGWTFDVNAVEQEEGVSVVRVALKREQCAEPPRFALRWRTTQRNVHHFWTPSSVHYGIPWNESVHSELTDWLPLYAFLDADDGNRFLYACSETVRPVEFRSPIAEADCTFAPSFEYFTRAEAPLNRYSTAIRIDTRPIRYETAIREASDWMSRAAECVPMPVPEAALEPVYSTWYSYHQKVTAGDVERECRLAADAGMKTVIVDDGWQIENAASGWTGYRFCGDWRPSAAFAENMKAHVAAVKAMGLKYVLWYSVPFVGEQSENYARFKNKLLPMSCAGGHVLDPRYAEVREFVAKTYEDAVREWDIDGLKLDFIGRFTLKGDDPAVADGYAGRDIKSIPVAVDTMLTDVMHRLRAIKPDILIEFRQGYVGTSIRKFGNMLRATDCPCSMVENRTRIARTRLVAGDTAVHSDMLEWRTDESPEAVSRIILNSIFGVIQYSVRLGDLPDSHLRVLRHWIGFSRQHRQALLLGKFSPCCPANDYPLLVGESPSERVIGVYQSGLVAETGVADRPVYVLNASNADCLTVDFSSPPARVEAFDAFGNGVETSPVAAGGVSKVKVPVSGYLRITWKEPEGIDTLRFMTFNLYGAGYGNPPFHADEREDRAMFVIRKYAPDLIAWQEINEGWWRSKLFAAGGDYVAIRGDEESALVSAGADMSKRKGNWVNHEPLSYRPDRLRLLDSGLDFYHVRLQVEKSLTWAVFENRSDGRRFIAFATHFWWQRNGPESEAIRELNARHVLDRISLIRGKWGNLPVVGGGDFNCETGASALVAFAQNGYEDAGESAPMRSAVPSEHGDLERDENGRCRGRVGKIGMPGHAMLDHVVYSADGIEPLRHDVIVDREAIDISDHSPVVVDFKLK